MAENLHESTHVSKSPSRMGGPVSRQPAYTHPLLQIQKSLGNRALLRLRGGLGILQTKLSLGQPDDLYEQEADAVARRVIQQMSKMNPDTQNARTETSQPVHLVQRQEEEDELVMPRRLETLQRQPIEEEEEKLQLRRLETIQRQEEEEDQAMPRGSEEDRSGSLVEGPVPNSIENQIDHARQGGEALDTTIRSRMESGFGYDFQNVNIHNDSVADTLSRQLSAEAFTLNNDIFFRNGRYDPASTQGQDLLAHELTHVVQQGAAPSHDVGVSAESSGGI